MRTCSICNIEIKGRSKLCRPCYINEHGNEIYDIIWNSLRKLISFHFKIKLTRDEEYLIEEYVGINLYDFSDYLLKTTTIDLNIEYPSLDHIIAISRAKNDNIKKVLFNYKNCRLITQQQNSEKKSKLADNYKEILKELNIMEKDINVN